MTPYTVWEAWFDDYGALRLFHPIYKGGPGANAVATAAFAGGPGDTRLRALIYGDKQTIDMEVRGGPYAEVPFVLHLYGAARDRDESYQKLPGP